VRTWTISDLVKVGSVKLTYLVKVGSIINCCSNVLEATHTRSAVMLVCNEGYFSGYFRLGLFKGLEFQISRLVSATIVCSNVPSDSLWNNITVPSRAPTPT